jgi:hypothetical protein
MFYRNSLAVQSRTLEPGQAQLDDGLVEFSSISSDASVDQLMAGFLKLAHGAHTEDQETVIQHIFIFQNFQTSRPIEGFKDLSDLQVSLLYAAVNTFNKKCHAVVASVYYIKNI